MPGYDFELILSRPLVEVELDPLFERTHGLVTVAVVRDLRNADRPGQAGCLWEAPTPEEITSALSAIIPHVA